MARKTETTKNEKSAPKTAKKAPKAKAAPVARGPLARVKAVHGSKESLVKKIVEPLAVGDEDTDALAGRLLKASNAQLLRLEKVVAAVKEKYGNRAKLIESIGKTLGKAKDKDYLAKLETFSLPRLYDLARGVAKRA